MKQRSGWRDPASARALKEIASQTWVSAPLTNLRPKAQRKWWRMWRWA